MHGSVALIKGKKIVHAHGEIHPMEISVHPPIIAIIGILFEPLIQRIGKTHG